MKGTVTTKCAGKEWDLNRTTHVILPCRFVQKVTCFFLKNNNKLQIDAKTFTALAMNNAQKGYIATILINVVKKEEEMSLNAMSSMIFASSKK